MSANQLFKSYIASLEGSGLPAVQAHYERLMAMSRNERFQWFCANRLGQTAPATPARRQGKKGETQAQKIARLERLVEQLTGESPVEVSKPAKREREVPVATRISWPMAITLIKGDVGDVKITGKSGKGRTADYKLTVDGRKITPAQASELIAAIKGR